MRPAEDTRPCRREGCGHERRMHDHYSRSTFCSKCDCGEWQKEHDWNTGFIAIVVMTEERTPGGRVKLRTIARAWALEFWINLTTEPMRLVPHPSEPVWWLPAGVYVCRRCGSHSARVQRKGQMQGEILRRRLS